MNASEARETAQKNLKTYVDQTYNDALQKVKQAVEKGRFSVYVNTLSRETEQRFISDGYKVASVQTGHNEYETEISW